MSRTACPWKGGAAAVVLLVPVCGCTVGPSYQRPNTAAAEAQRYQQDPADSPTPLSGDALDRWWEEVNDPWLDDAIARLARENLALQEAAARIRQAWAEVGMEAGARWPTLSVSGSATRRAETLEGFGVGSALPGGTQRFYSTLIQAAVSTSWQVDLFGRIERRTTASRQRYQAAQADAQALLHSLIAELVRRRVTWTILDQLLRLARDTVENRTLTLEIVERRYQQGAAEVSAGDVYLAQENVASVSADVPDLRRQMTAQRFAIDRLLGRPPGTTPLAVAGTAPTPPSRPAPPGVPAGLLDRRPDLRAAELRIMAATEDIGIAVADLYPELTLRGHIGPQDSDLHNFFRTENLVGAIAGDVLLRLFEGGRLRARIDLREARARELAAAYARRVLNALEEVETALSNERHFAERLREQRRALEASRRAEREARTTYGAGIGPLLDLLETERRRYAAERGFLSTARAAWNNRVALYLALGGDWPASAPPLEPAPLPVEDGT